MITQYINNDYSGYDKYEMEMEMECEMTNVLSRWVCPAFSGNEDINRCANDALM